MFYSHEILTSRKHGVATVWLVATLGSKSSTKKITRKAILDVDVKKACNTILEPEAPMALRLQSNLLYGVSRVYGQQVGYVLSDTIHVEQGLRSLGKKLVGSLDLNGVKVKPAQLMLMDDPAFDPDMPLPGLFPDYDFNIDADDLQNRDSQLSLSINSQRGRSISISSSQGASILGLNISSSLSAGGYQLPFNDPFVQSSAQKSGAHGNEFEGEAILFEDNDIFEFDQDGEIRDFTAQDIASRRAASTSAGPRFGNDSAASARVRKEHDDARVQAGGHGHIYDEDDMNMVFGDDDEHLMLPDAVPFAAFMGGSVPVHGREQSISQLEDSSSESAAAPSRPRKPKIKKQLPIDQTQELKNSDLSNWQREYVSTQDGLSAAKLTAKGQTLAKKNALMFVIGNGLNGVGIGIGSTKLPGPLSMFSGDVLLANITGRVFGPRKRQADSERDENIPSKRLRHSSEEVPRGIGGDNDFAVQVDDGPIGTPVEVERGRDAADTLADYPSSAMMPWNLSASQRARSSSLRPSASLRPGGRGVSASPLVGRGSILLGGGDLEKFSSQQDIIMYGRSDDISTNLGEGSGDGMNVEEWAGDDREKREFEMFGPAANVDTQTAGQSQWVRSIMDTESENFLDFVRMSIEERIGEDEDVFGEHGKLKDKKVGFEELFDPEINSEVVAAQAFLHILTLATKGRIWVNQDEGESLGVGGNGLGGEIWLGCL